MMRLRVIFVMMYVFPSLFHVVDVVGLVGLVVGYVFLSDQSLAIVLICLVWWYERIVVIVVVDGDGWI